MSDWFKNLFIDEAKAAIDSRGSSEDENAQYELGYEVGIIEGAQNEYDRFWDAYQDNGNRTNYESAFFGAGWTNASFKPKYKTIRPTSVSNMFRGSSITIDYLPDYLVIDFSVCPNAGNMFYAAQIFNVGVMDVSTVGSLNYMFNYALTLVTIEKLVLKADGSQSVDGLFNQCNSLTNLTVEGLFGASVDLRHSKKLSTTSMKSVITHLKNFSGTDKASTCTVKFHEDCWAALAVDGTTAPDGSTWRDYVESTLCWLT